MGEPCAGQVRAIPWSFFSLNVDDSSFDENFGFDDPTGSIKKTHSKSLLLFTQLPECWNRMSLSRASNSNTLSKTFDES